MKHGRAGKYTAELVAEVCRAAKTGDETHREIAKLCVDRAAWKVLCERREEGE